MRENHLQSSGRPGIRRWRSKVALSRESTVIASHQSALEHARHLVNILNPCSASHDYRDASIPLIVAPMTVEARAMVSC